MRAPGMNRFHLPGVLMICAGIVLPQTTCRAGDGLVAFVAAPPVDTHSVLDVRSLGECQQASLAGARCLPAGEFLGGHRRLANFSGVLWLLGTVGLTGEEHVLVVGDSSDHREFVGGLLFLMGQRKVSILTAAVSRLPDPEPTQAGRARSATREVVFQAPVRGDRVRLREELKQQIHTREAPVLLDGRTEQEYWGLRIRANRGGHIPGAQHLPSAAVGKERSEGFALPSGIGSRLPVAYGHDTYEGLVYLSRLTAGGVEVALLLDGWSGWAADTTLPVDSVTYPEKRFDRVERAGTAAGNTHVAWPVLIAAMIAGAVLTAAGFWLGRSLAAARGRV